jgi:hypothetical protein
MHTLEEVDWELAILTNLPKTVSAVVVAEAYRTRWTIEGGFLDLTTTLDCEIMSSNVTRSSYNS